MWWSLGRPIRAGRELGELGLADCDRLSRRLAHALQARGVHDALELLGPIWPVQHRRIRLLHNQARLEEEQHLVLLLCQLAACQEDGSTGRTAGRLVAGGWHGDPVELIETARAITAG